MPNGNGKSLFKDMGVRDWVYFFIAISVIVGGGGSAISNYGVQQAVKDSIFSESEVRELAREVSKEFYHPDREEIRAISKNEAIAQQQVITNELEHIKEGLGRIETDLRSVKQELNLR